MIVRELIWALGFKVDPKPAEKAERAVANIDKAAMKSKGGLFGLSQALQGLSSGIQIFQQLAQGGRFLLGTISSFEQLRAQLTTIEQDVGKADAAFGMLQDFATTTPFQLQNVVESFSKLRAVGLDPTTDDLKAMGDIAAGMGKDITEFAGAVVGATTGEMDRLKAFGIVAKQEGDKVEFLFKGQKKTVKKNAKDISAYLYGLGRAEFSGGMERQMNTINGAVSNLKDNLAKFADAVGRNGLAKEINAFTRELTDAVGEGDSLAVVLGQTLGKAVKVLSKAFKIAKDNAGLLETSLKVITGVAVVGQIVKIAGVIKSTAALVGMASLPFLLLAVAVIGLGLAFEDVYGFLTGKSSILGDTFDELFHDGKAGTAQANFQKNFAAIKDAVNGLLDFFANGVNSEAFKAFMTKVNDGIDVALDSVEGKIGDRLRRVKDLWDMFWGNADLAAPIIASLNGGMKAGFAGTFPLLAGAMDMAGVASFGTPTIPQMIGGGAANPGIDAQRRVSEVQNNKKTTTVNAGGLTVVLPPGTGGDDPGSVLDAIRAGAAELVTELFSGAAADLEGSVI